MSNFVIDVEADGPCPGLYSMVNFGVVKIDNELKDTFYGEVRPISDKWIPEALAISGFSREEHLKFQEPVIVMGELAEWISSVNKNGRPIMWSDNVAFDWQWVNYYFHAFHGPGNPFGYSARRIGDVYCGLVKDARARWKWMRDTKHDHNPVNDAKGNAEALLKIRDKGVKIKFV